MSFGRSAGFMNQTDSTIYAVCIKGEPVRYSAQSKIVPIMGNSCQLTQEERLELKAEGYVFDDENAYCSKLNPWLGELSCIHWMIVNAAEGNIGNAQYRRNWIEPENEWYDADTLYVTEPAHFGCSLERQFRGGHSFDGVGITLDLARTGLWAFSEEEIQAVWQQNLFHGCIMARGPIAAYKQFMTTLFSCLFPIWETHKEDFLRIEGYDKRALAFLAERIMTGLVLHREKFFPGMNIQTAPIGFISN